VGSSVGASGAARCGQGGPVPGRSPLARTASKGLETTLRKRIETLEMELQSVSHIRAQEQVRGPSHLPGLVSSPTWRLAGMVTNYPPFTCLNWVSRGMREELIVHLLLCFTVQEIWELLSQWTGRGRSMGLTVSMAAGCSERIWSQPLMVAATPSNLP